MEAAAVQKNSNREEKFMKNAKNVFIVLLAVLLIFSVTACSSTDTDPQQDTTVDATGDAVQSENTSEDTQENKPAFGEDTSITANLTTWTWDTGGVDLEMSVIQKKYPGIKMEYAVVSSDDYLKKVQTTVASGEKLPDIINADGYWRGKLYNMGILERLDAEPYNLDRSTIFDYALPYMVTEKDEVVGVVKPGSPAGLAYSADLAEKYLGTSDPEELEKMMPDWESFINVGKDVLQKSNGSVKMIAGYDDLYQIIGYQNANPYIIGNKLNLEKSVGPAIQKMIEMRDAGIIGNLAMWSSSWHASYTNSSVLFYPCATWSIRWQLQVNDEAGDMNWRLMVPPEGGFNWGGGAGCITRDSENKEAAWIVLREAGLSTECAVEYMNKLQWFSILKEAYDDPRLSSYKYDYLGGQDIVNFYVNTIPDTIKNRTCTSDDAAIEAAVALVRTDMLTDNSITYESALKKIAEELKLTIQGVTD